MSTETRAGSMSAERPRPVDGFPRDRLFELLRQVRDMITGTDRQLALLADLRIPAPAVLGRPGVAPRLPERMSGASSNATITVPAPPLSRAVAPSGRPTADRPPEPRADYLPYQQPAPTDPRQTGSSSGGEIAGPDRPDATPMPAQRFAEALLDVVSTAEHLDASIILARRGQSELPVEQRPDWSGLLADLERLQVENRRRSLASGRSPDLTGLSGWDGFECLHHYSLTDRFFGREKYLERLDAWAVDADAASVLCLTALGGAGKSALAWRWLNGALTRLRQDGFRGALWCSFYEGTFTFEDFLRRALAFCGRMQPEGVAALSREQVEIQLLAALARDRYVLVVDGLERLMIGYSQAAERAIDDEGTRGATDRDGSTRQERRMANRRDGAFLARLATPLASRLLITTRLAPADLDPPDGGRRGAVEVVELPGLTRGDAFALWTDILPGSRIDDEIAAVLDGCGYHPLAISILARSVAVGGAGWAGWRQAPQHRDFALIGSTAQVRAHVIELCRRDLGAEAEEVLNLLAVSGKPMRLDEVEEALRQHSIAHGEERWTLPGRVQLELRSLIDLGYVGEAVVDGLPEYDLHPVVRGVVWRSMTDPVRTPDRSRILDQVVSELTAVPDPHVAGGPVNLQKAASIFRVLVTTGRSDRAWEMFRYKLWEPLYFSGAYRELLDLFEQLLPGGDPLQLLPLRSRREQADAADLLAHLLMTGGDSTVADRLMVWCGVIRLRINDDVGFLDIRRAQTWQCLYQGRLIDAEVQLRQVKVHAGAMGVGRIFATADPWIGLVLALRGCTEEARRYLTVDDRDEPNRRWWLQAAAEGHVYLGDNAAALELLSRLPHDAEQDVDPLQRAWERLTAGMAHAGAGDHREAQEDLLAGLSTARRTGYRIIECFALVALAEIAVAAGRWRDVEDWVEQYFRVDAAGQYRLTAGEAWRLRALCAEQRGELDEALGHAAAAYRACACDGPPFVYAAGLRRARDLLMRLGGYLPRTSSALHPAWLQVLEGVRRDEADVAAMDRRGGVVLAGFGDDPAERQRRARMADVVHLAAEDDRRWWTLVAGTDPTLTVPLTATMVDLGISIAELRRLFAGSEEKSLEVVFFRLYADRVVAPDPPAPVGALTPAQRSRWLDRVDEHEAALDTFLRSEQAVGTERPFRYQGLDARGVEAFSRDGRRRIRVDEASADARRWWNQLEQRRDPWDMLILAECIQSAPATLEEFVDAVSVTGARGIEYGFLSLREKRATARLRVTAVSRTDGWSAFDVRLRLQTVKYQLGWLDLAEPVRDFWATIEQRNAHQPRLVLQLAEELALRGSTIDEYHEASLRSSDPEDPRATLAYLDYLRLAATPWRGDAWPDDVSVRRWSYDTATPAFRDVSTWTAGQVTRWLDVVQERIGYESAPARARRWWDDVAETASGATMVRLAEEVHARGVEVADVYRAHVDAGSDNLLAVLSYLDFALVARRQLSEDAVGQGITMLITGNTAFERGEYAAAATAYEAAVRADPRNAEAYFYLALAVEQLDLDGVTWQQRPEDVLRRGIALCADSTKLEVEVERLALGLPPFPPADLRRVSVELSAALVVDVEQLLNRVEGVRAGVRSRVGVAFPGVQFRQNDALPPGGYRILFEQVPVADGETVPGSIFRLAPGVPEEPFWPSVTSVPDGGWEPGEPPPARPGRPPLRPGLTPHDYLLRHLRTALAALAGRCLTGEMVLALVEDSWSARLDPDHDLPLIAAFTEILRIMLDDQVPITDTDVLLDEYRVLHRTGVPPGEAVVRLRLLPAVRGRLPGNRERDVRVPLDPAVERRFVEDAVLDDAGGTLAVHPMVLQAVLEAVRSPVPPHPAGDLVLVVGAASHRRAVRLLLRAEFAALPVVAQAELLPRDGR